MDLGHPSRRANATPLCDGQLSSVDAPCETDCVRAFELAALLATQRGLDPILQWMMLGVKDQEAGSGHRQRRF